MRDTVEREIESCPPSPEGAIERIEVFLKSQIDRCRFMEKCADDHDGDEEDYRKERRVYEETLQRVRKNSGR